ncbi:MAG: signal peptidase II [Candidatus Omnitrophica bacterium]|nr:signal peptidase II [Candidatus Omnitrophota bacterium]
MPLAVWIAVLLVISDQFSKFLILSNLKPGESVPIIKNIFHISYVCNRGMAFGMFSGAKLLFICSGLLAVAIILFIFYKRLLRQSKSIQVFLLMILSGAVGNLIDRLRFGYVIDFLDFRIWPVFNIADASITIGTALLILQILRHKPRQSSSYI